MTTGSFSNIVRYYTVLPGLGTCSFDVGMSKSWTGADSTTLRAERRALRERIVSYVPVQHVSRRKGKGLDRQIVTELRQHAFGVQRTGPKAHTSELAVKRAREADMGLFDHVAQTRFRWSEESERSPPSDYGAPHPYSASWLRVNEGVFTFSQAGWPPGSQGTISALGWGAQNPASSWDSSCDYKVIERLRSRIVGNDFSLFTNLGAEGRDTVRFIGEISNRIYRAQVAIRKGNLGQAVRIATYDGRVYRARMNAERRALQLDSYRDALQALSGKRGPGAWSQHSNVGSTATNRVYRGGKELSFLGLTADAWLTYQLAIEPLLGDVTAAAEQLAHITNHESKQSYSASLSKKTKRSIGANEGLWAINTRTEKKSIRAHFVHTPEWINFMGLTDPEVTIWNALPLSFVADYFLPIGSFLEARAAAAHMPVGTYITSWKNEVYQRNLLGYIGNGTLKGSALDGLQFFRRTGSFDRVISSVLDVPLPTMKPLNKAFSWQHTATMVALVVGSNPFRYN